VLGLKSEVELKQKQKKRH